MRGFAEFTTRISYSKSERKDICLVINRVELFGFLLLGADPMTYM